MEDNILVSRRSLLATGVALSTTLAGCSSNEDSGSTNTPESTSEGTRTPEPTPENTPEPTPEETATPEEDPTPSLSEFDYPEGASQDGLDGAGIYGTHESSLTGAGSLTLTTDTIRTFDSFEESVTRVNQFDARNIHVKVEQSDDSPTEYRWSPSDTDLTYVQMESGFNTDYRIDNQAPETNTVTGLNAFEQYLTATEWGEATEVVETADGYGVVYNDTGVSQPGRIAFGGEIDQYEASATVSESGYVVELTYDLTITFDDGETQQEQVTASLSKVGGTTVEEPEWASTAREQGVQFDIRLTDGGNAYEVEMVNGGEVPEGTRISLNSNQNRGSQRLSQALSVGDTLYIGLSNSGELLLDTDKVPDGVAELSGFTALRMRSDFPLFTHEERL
jgi:outer membrane lipoprotein SlyB